jgi:hypothetical protein
MNGAQSCTYNRYICSRIFLHNPPGDDNALRQHPQAPAALKQEEYELIATDPEVNQYVCIAMILVSIGIMAATAEWVSNVLRFSISLISMLNRVEPACRKYRVRQRRGAH